MRLRAVISLAVLSVVTRRIARAERRGIVQPEHKQDLCSG